MFRKISNIFLELIFPSNCFACKKPGEIVCIECLQSINLLSHQVCPVCEKNKTNQGAVCLSCFKKKDLSLNNLIVTADYRNQKLAHAIHLLKYQFISELSFPLGKIMTKGLKENNLINFDFIIPIPLHSRRLRWRGFNQSQLLASVIAHELFMINSKSVLLDDLVLRHKWTTPQMKIEKYSSRLANMENAFILNKHYFRNKNKLENKNFLLVDDVCTTGATLANCAKALKPIKPKKISAIVLGR
ncbi:MAG TPA: ComF family protein [Candidatus Moranbacteria bacterium]|nr:ComF family protein [Candidatus Moranbacteria bacterium]